MQLRILSGKREGEVVELDAGEHVIGTGKSATISLREQKVGFKHARLSIEDDAVLLEDLESRHGTFVNEERLEGSRWLESGDVVRLGTVQLRLEGAQVNGAAAPAKASEGAAAPAKASELAQGSDEPLPDDPARLQALVRELRRSLAEKTQEAQALHEAIEGGGSGGGSGGVSGDGLGGLSAGVSEDLEARVLELQTQADSLAAESLEKGEVIANLESELARFKDLAEERQAQSETKKSALADDLLRAHEKLEDMKQQVSAAEAEVATFEETNANLLLEVEELKEAKGELEYRLEVEANERGSLVRERVAELQQRSDKVTEGNAELRTLVEAYEEKIDELDERVEELEGENEALEAVVADLRQEIKKVEHDRETMVKTLRNRLRRAEQRVDVAEHRTARAEASASARLTPGGTTSASASS